MQAQQDGGRLDRTGGVAVVLGRELVEGELVLAADLPQEVGVEGFRLALGVLQQQSGPGFAALGFTRLP